MIVKRTWYSKKGGIFTKYQYTGWFLFGFIPLYIIRR